MNYLTQLSEIPLDIKVEATIPNNSLNLKSGKYKPDYLAYQLTRIAKTKDMLENIAIKYESSFTLTNLTKVEALKMLNKLSNKSFSIEVFITSDGNNLEDRDKSVKPEYGYTLLKNHLVDKVDLVITINDIKL